MEGQEGFLHGSTLALARRPCRSIHVQPLVPLCHTRHSSYLRRPAVADNDGHIHHAGVSRALKNGRGKNAAWLHVACDRIP